jgi:hypothetical protein
MEDNIRKILFNRKMGKLTRMNAKTVIIVIFFREYTPLPKMAIILPTLVKNAAVCSRSSAVSMPT